MKSIIGLDIGNRNIKFVELTLRGKKVELTKFNILETPASSSQYEVSDLLKRDFKINQVKLTNPVSLSISADEAFFKIISIKSRGTKKIKDAIKDELKKNIVFSLEDCIWDYCFLKHKPKESKDDFLLVAAKKDAVTQKEQLLEKINNLSYFINIDMLSIYNCLKFNGDIAAGKLYAVVDISSTKTQVFVFDEGGDFWIRNVAFGGDKFTDSLVKNLGLSAKEAEEYKNNMAFSKDIDPVVQDASLPILEELSQEIDKAFNYYYFQASESTAKGTEHKIDEVLLSGGGSIYPGIESFLSKSLKIPTKHIYPLRNVIIKDKKLLAKKDILNVIAPQLAAAIGSGLGGLNFSQININLGKSSQKSFLEKLKTSSLFNIVITACVALLVYFSAQTLILNKQLRDVSTKDKELSSLVKDMIPQIKSLKDEYDKIGLKVHSLNNVIGGRSKITNVLSSISQAVPQDLWITDFVMSIDYEANKNELTINGKAISYAGINKLIASLKDIGYFDVVEPVSSKVKIDEITKEEVVNFMIKLETK